MEIKGVIWVGSASDDLDAARGFFAGQLGMDLVTDVSGFMRFAAANGDRIEFFGPDTEEHDQLDTGPVAGLWVEDANEARRELVSAGAIEVTELKRGPEGHAWFYVRAPDGNFYEICEHPEPRPPKGVTG